MLTLTLTSMLKLTLVSAFVIYLDVNVDMALTWMWLQVDMDVDVEVVVEVDLKSFYEHHGNLIPSYLIATSCNIQVRSMSAAMTAHIEPEVEQRRNDKVKQNEVKSLRCFDVSSRFVSFVSFLFVFGTSLCFAVSFYFTSSLRLNRNELKRNQMNDFVSISSRRNIFSP